MSYIFLFTVLVKNILPKTEMIISSEAWPSPQILLINNVINDKTTIVETIFLKVTTLMRFRNPRAETKQSKTK